MPAAAAAQSPSSALPSRPEARNAVPGGARVLPGVPRVAWEAAAWPDPLPWDVPALAAAGWGAWGGARRARRRSAAEALPDAGAGRWVVPAQDVPAPVAPCAPPPELQADPTPRTPG